MSSDSDLLKEVMHVEASAAAYLQALRNARIMGRCLVVAMLLCVALVVAIVVMLPLKEKEIVMVEFRKASDNVVLLEKADGRVQSNQKLISYTVRMYVSDRESVDKITEAKIRYPRVRDMSTREVWESFQKIYGSKDSGPVFQPGLKRAIDITSDSRLADGIHEVEFSRIDTVDGQPGELITKWKAVIRYGFADRKVTEAEAMRNPIGLIVAEYSIKARQE